MTIGEYMKAAREDVGLSLRELSKLSGVPISTIDTYEKGKACPGILNLISLADSLETSIDDYIGHVVKE